MDRVFVRSWRAVALRGLASIVFGALAVMWPETTALVLVALLGAWAMVTGFLELAIALRLRRAFALGVAGVVSILLGVALLSMPRVSALVVVVVAGCYATFYGVSLLTLAVQTRRMARHAAGASRDIARSRLVPGLL